MTTLVSEAALEFVEAAEARLDDDGFFYMKIAIGPLLSEMEQMGYSRVWGDPLAIDFYTCILADEVLKLEAPS